jgi:mono/diheme cytochrome c family protein
VKSLLLLIAFFGCALMGGGGQVVAADLTKSRIADGQIRTQIITGWKDKQGVLKMPAFEDKLTEKQLAELVGVVKGLRK